MYLLYSIIVMQEVLLFTIITLIITNMKPNSIATHNSLSYLKPIHWYHRLLKPWYQCQDLTIQEQYNLGVRIFDIRVKQIKGIWYFCHNHITFTSLTDITGEHIINTITTLTKADNCLTRLCLDERNSKNLTETYIHNFLHLAKQLKQKGWNIFECIDLVNYTNYTEIVPISMPPYIEYHASVAAKWYEYILGCKWFAKHHNKQFMNNNSKYNYIYMMDYVQHCNVNLFYYYK